jgi:hypothetical protein
MSQRDNHKIKLRIPWLIEVDATGLGILAAVFIVALVVIVARFT